MKTLTKELLNDLKQRTQQVIADTKLLETCALDLLNQRDTPTEWSALECIEHLNRYSRFYVPEFQKRIEQSGYNAEPNYSSGWLGNYFAKSMLPREDLNKMKTFSSMNPLGSSLDKKTLHEFLDFQNKILEVLLEAEKVSLSKTKSSITIASWIKLQLGDALRVVIYHNQRHLLQACKAAGKQSSVTARL